MAKKVIVGGRIESKEVGGIVTGAAEILDDSKGKKQSVINQETDAELLRLDGAKQDVLTFDNVPTEGSDNPVKSGGLYTAQQAILLAIAAINELIPSAASALNQLADKAFVNSSISTNTATFRGTSAAGLNEQQFLAWANGLEHDLNDYVFWQTSDAAGNTLFKRYKWNGTEWAYEYTLNNSTFTAEQWEAIQSGITALLVTKLRALPTAQELIQSFDGKQDVLTFDDTPTLGSNNPVKSSGIYNVIKAITDLVPSEATAQNQLADKADVAAKIVAAIPSWKGQYDALTDLQAVTGAKAGDMGCVKTTDSDGHAVLTFFQYSAQGAWVVYYTLRHYAQNKPATTGTTGDYPYNGMGRIELQKNIVNGVNTLTQAMITQQNTIYVIQYDFTLGEDITVPANCVLEFDGGSINTGNITLDNTTIISSRKCFDGVSLSGTITNEHVDVRWFGAVADYIDGVTQNPTNNDTAFEAAISACEALGATFYIPDNKCWYWFTTPMVFDATYDVDIQGDIIYNGSENSTAITVTGTSKRQTLKNVYINGMHEAYIPSITVDSSTDVKTATVPDNVGIKIVDINQARITINLLYHFSYGLVVEGANSSKGCCYNTFYLGIIVNAYKGVLITCAGTGWANENLFINGRFSVQTLETVSEVARGICIDSQSTYRNNCNMFLKPCFETYVGVEIIKGRYNTIINARTEGVAYPMITENGSHNNLLIPSWYGTNENRYNELLQEGSRYGGLSEMLINLASRGEMCVYDSGNLDYAYTPFTNRGNGISFNHLLAMGDFSGENPYPYFQLSSDGLIKGAGGSPLFGAEVVFCSDEKELTIALYGAGRLYMRLYDSQGNTITDITKVVVEDNSNQQASDGSFIIIGEANFPLRNNIFKARFDSSVYRAYIMLAIMNSDSAFGRMAIYSKGAVYSPTKDKEAIALAKPTGVGGGVTKVLCDHNTYTEYNNRYTVPAANVTHWDLINGNWIPSAHKGTLSQRPTSDLNSDVKGYEYFATDSGTNGKMLWWNGSAWVDATGTPV